jgi:hypothetical protein
VENGTLIMETTFTNKERFMLQENNHYHYGMEIELLDVTKNRVRVRVRAEFHEGKVVAINIEENVLRFGDSKNVRVRFDGKQIQRGTVEQVMAASGEQARYIETVGEGGAQFLVYIPHFSEHMIELESLLEEELFTGTNYVVMGISILALIGLSGHIYRIGRARM